MELKPGYKKTEVGVIPENWNCSALGNLCDTSSGTTPSRSLIERYFRGGTINWVKTLDLNNSVIFSTDECVTEAALNETSLRVYPKNTVLVAMYGGFNQIGRTGILSIPACVNQAITAVRCGAQLDAGYLLAILNFKVEYWKSVASSSRKDPNITSKDIRDFIISYPPKAEQQGIAEALSNADALIESLDQLIAKKRQIKQGAMQELLTGKRRLPGFSGEWEVVQAGDIGYFKGGSGFPTRFQGGKSGEYPFYKVSDMNIEGNEIFMKNANNYIDDGLRRQVGATSFPANSIVFAKVGAAVFLERKKILSQASCLDNNMAALILDDTRADFRFIHFVLLNKNLGNLVSATALPSLSNSVLATIELVLPPRAEQTAIATILSDMDCELAALESRLAKARKIKQGMMHELLTGRIRLI